MIQVLALEIDLRPAELIGQALGMVDRTRPPNVMLELVLEFGDELRVVLSGGVGLVQFGERRN